MKSSFEEVHVHDVHEDGDVERSTIAALELPENFTVEAFLPGGIAVVRGPAHEDTRHAAAADLVRKMLAPREAKLESPAWKAIRAQVETDEQADALAIALDSFATIRALVGLNAFGDHKRTRAYHDLATALVNVKTWFGVPLDEVDEIHAETLEDHIEPAIVDGGEVTWSDGREGLEP